MYPPPPTHNHPDPDSATRSTDTDAAHSRLSAVRLGYLSDPYLVPLVPRSRLVPTRAPLMNVGTYVRATAIDALVEGWLDLMGGAEEEGVQVVCLGAGSDTRFWRLMEKGYGKHIRSYVELDFTENTARKAKSIMQSSVLSKVLGSDVKIERGGTALTSPVYHLLPIDLRDLPSLTSLVSPPTESIDSPSTTSYTLNTALPTLFIAECVFVYMPPPASASLVQWFADTFPRAAGVVYEMFGLGDPFGRVLKDNLKARHIEIPGAEAFPTLASQISRFPNSGMPHARGRTLKDIRRENVSASELQRISRLEHLDEIEELELLLTHYAITWGYSDRTTGPSQSDQSTGASKGGLEGWNLPSQVASQEEAW